MYTHMYMWLYHQLPKGWEVTIGNHVCPEVGAGSVVALSVVEQERQTVVFLAVVQREEGGDGDVLGQEAEGTVGDGVREDVCQVVCGGGVTVWGLSGGVDILLWLECVNTC